MKTFAKILLLVAFLIPNVVLAEDEPKKLYSHRSGSWTDCNSWTTDPSGINYINPDDAIPDANTAVYIIAGASITVPDQFNGTDYKIDCISIMLNGELVLNNHTGHNVAQVIEGDGRVVLHIENYPTVTNNKFVKDGGTTVFQNAIVSVSSGHEYSNLEINNSTVTFAGNVNCAGSVSVVSGGTLIFNNSVQSTVTVKGDFQVNNGCSVYVDKESKPFDLKIGGDLRNDGTINFTNRTECLDHNDDKGFVNVHFNSTTRNQTVSCNNKIYFYAIYMEKGTSDDYVLRFTAYNKENFHIYGPANVSANQNIILDGGTLEIGSNIVIPFLNKQEFYIPANSTILVNAGKVNDNDAIKGSIFVEGKLKVAYTGEVKAMNKDNGITLKKSGILEIDGGNVKAAYIKNGNENDDYGSYYQIGGNVIVDNEENKTMCFSLSNPNSGFLMKGGVLTINHGGLKILSSSANCSVEGGKVVLKSTIGNQALVASTVAFPSLTIENVTDMKVLPALDYPLKVNGDLVIGDNCTLEYNSADVYVAGNLIADGKINFTSNTTYIYGNGNTDIKIKENDFEFANLTISKSSPTATITTNHSFSVTDNLTITGGVFVNGEHDINISRDISIENGEISSTSGYIKLEENLNQHILTSPLHNPCCFGNLSYAGTQNLKLNGPIITQNFLFEGAAKLVELNGHYVEVKGVLDGDGPTHYFINNGSVSGGLVLHFTLKKGEDKNIYYHIGDNSNENTYTPATIVVTGSMLTQDYTGSVRVNAVGKAHPNLVSEQNNIERYWVVSQTGFDDVPNGVVQYKFINHESVDPSYVPAALVPFKGWKHSETIVDGSDTFWFGNANYGLISADFTCAKASDYNIKVYRTYSGTKPNKDADDPMYRNDNVNFNDKKYWRLLDENGEEIDVEPNSYPGPHDIAYVYFNRVNVKANWEVGQLVFVDDNPLYAPDDLEHQPRIQVWEDYTVHIHRLSGEGVIAQRIKTSENVVIIDDISAFAKESHSWIMYILVNDVNDVQGYPEIPNLGLEDPHNFSFGNKNQVINFDLNMRGNVKYNFPSGSGGNLTIGRDLYIGDWKGAQILFNANGSSHTLTVKGDVILSHNGNPKSYNDGVRNITVYPNPSSATLLEHRLVVGGNIHLGSKNLQLHKKNGSKITGIILELNGNKDAELIHYDPSNPTTNGTLQLWKIVMNKESGKSFTINRDFELFSATETYSKDEIKPITMLSGHLILNNNESSKNYILSAGEDHPFIINADAELETNGLAQYTVKNDMQLSGGLKLDDNSVWNVEKSIIYTESATCNLYIGDATMNVGAQLRPPEAAGGSISLTLANANSELNVGTNADITPNTRGIFELVNMSSLTMVPSSKIYIKNYIANSPVPDININPNSCNIDSTAEIIVDAGKDKYTTILSNVEIPRLSVINNSMLKMKGALTVNRLLTIGNYSTFATGGYKLYLKGNANNIGSFEHDSCITYICGDSTQYINGAFTFYDLVKNTNDTVKFKDAIVIDNKSDFLKGVFVGNSITAKGNVVNNAIYHLSNYDPDNKTQGFIFGGEVLQLLESDGNGKFDKIVLNNQKDVKLPTGNSFTVIKNFQLNTGNFDLGTCTITMDKDAIFTVNNGASYGVNNMIRVTDAYATGGVRKVFGGTTAQPYEIPIGTTGKYTPVTINADKIDDGGSLTIRPVNEMTNCSPGNSILGYYWVVKADSIDDFDGTLKFKFDENESTAESMVGVFQCDATNKFTKFNGTGVWNKNIKELTFEFSNEVVYTSDSISGNFLGSTVGDIALYVPEYYAFGEEAEDVYANWTNDAIWYTYNETQKVYVAASIVPTNAVVHIFNNVKMNADCIVECKTYIEEGAVLDQVKSMHNDLGAVAGKGTLKSATGDLPAGVYDEFNSVNGGTIHYYGGGENGEGYSILKQMPVVNNLIIQSEGNGEVKKFPNMPVQILGNFTINGNVNNEANAVISLKGDLKYEFGHFTTGNLGQSQFIFNGDKWQSVTGLDFTPQNCIFNMTINNPEGVELHNNVFVHNTIEFIQGVINSGKYEGLLTLDNAESDCIYGFGSESYVDGPFRKRINNGENYTFPVGNTNDNNNTSTPGKRYGPLTIQNTNTNGSVYWTVRYFYDSPYEWESFEDNLLSVSNNEYWSIYTEDNTYQAQILTRWDGLSPIMNETLKPEDLRQVYFNRESGKWEISGSNVVVTNEGGYVESFTARNITKKGALPDLFSFGFQTEWNYSWCGCEDDDWFNVKNWVMGFYPTDRTPVKIGGDFPHWPVIRNNNPKEPNGPATAGSLTLCDNAKLDIESHGKLTVSKDLTVAPTAKLTLRADTKTEDNNHSIPPTGSLIYHGKFDGKLTFQRFVRSYEFERMCVPVTGYDANVSNFRRSAWIYSYDETFNIDKLNGNYYRYEDGIGDDKNPEILSSAWKDGATINTSSLTTPYRYISYPFLAAHAISFTGTPLLDATQNVKVNVTFTENDQVNQPGFQPDLLDGWNLIANPYVSAVDASQLEFYNVDKVIYLHDNIDDSPLVYAIAAGVSAGVVTNYADGKYIPAGQSFFVHAKNTAEEKSLVFTPQSRSHGSATMKIKSGKNDGNIDLDKIIFLTNGLGQDFQSVVYFANDATEGFDSHYDAYLQTTTLSNVLQFYSFGSDYKVPLIVNGLPDSIKDGGEIRLGYSTVTGGTYTVSVPTNTVTGTTVYLTDTENGTVTPISNGFSCKINVAAGTNNSRFKLVFKTNNAPVAKASVADAKGVANENFEYTIGTDLFADNDPGDYVANIDVVSDGGAALPSWLYYNYESGVFSGKPTSTGVYRIAITATDSHGAKSIPLTFAITIESNNLPLVNDDNNLVTVEDPVIPILVNPHDPMPIEPILPIIVDPILPEVDNNNDVTVTEPTINDNTEVEENNGPEELPLIDPMIPFVDEPLVDPFNQDLFADVDVKVYPVPSNGRVTVEYGSLTQDFGSVQMTIVSISGRIILTKTLYGEKIDLDLSGRAGIYLIRLATPAKTITKRIVIQ